MEFNEKAKARESDFLKIDGQMGRYGYKHGAVMYVDKSLRYHTDSSLQIQKLYGNTLRAGKMAMPPLSWYVHFLLKLERIFSCVCHFFK